MPLLLLNALPKTIVVTSVIFFFGIGIGIILLLKNLPQIWLLIIALDVSKPETRLEILLDGILSDHFQRQIIVICRPLTLRESGGTRVVTSADQSQYGDPLRVEAMP